MSLGNDRSGGLMVGREVSGRDNGSTGVTERVFERADGMVGT